ncbi:hypothetical protein RMSM_03716 [Rhodopirellula maiorica SM1]|uniref:Uncharacterized protein n=1 Tax=Rhodopirellula maiorica SM1 TaxID=1265738 RepID=M5RZJ0_9BACT|nr:hypothetical protein [Rhodopirellula maiorica]EMI19329.1 hypothetical protein RMSM_03716 [Rhodopirellula maiorica SM1]
MSTQAATSNNRLPDTSSTPQSTTDPWEPVFTAINIRWPQINQDELKQCDRSVDELTEFVAARVDTQRDEIDSVVSEFAPTDESPLRSFVDQAHRAGEQVSNSVHSAVERVQYEIDELPVKTSLTNLAIGFGLGVLATTLYFNSRRQPTTWQQIRSNRLFQ